MKRYAFQIPGFSKEREMRMREEITREVKEEMLKQTEDLKHQLEALQQQQCKKRRLIDPTMIGGGKKKLRLNVVSPTQQAVRQAKALIVYKRKLDKKKTKTRRNGRKTRRIPDLGRQSGRKRAVRGL